MRVVFATAEFAPVAAVGGLAEAAAGLTAELRRQGVDVDVLLPDYGGVELAGETRHELDVPAWAAPASVREGVHPVVGRLHLVHVPGIERVHPYTAADGTGWPDNDERFFRFGAAVATYTTATRPDVLHLNDWHTATTLAGFTRPPPSVLSIHNLAYQGVADGRWLAAIGPQAAHYEWWGGINPLAGAIALADVVVAVSPQYARSIVSPEEGCGLHAPLAARGMAVRGILNGIDIESWDPANDPAIPAPYAAAGSFRSILGAKAASKAAVARHFGFADDDDPLVTVVTRLTWQKGIDLLAPVIPLLRRIPARLALLGSGDARLAEVLTTAAAAHPEQFGFHDGYDAALSRLMFAGGDLYLMPSRFEPCGLAQMQAMRYGTPPVVTPTGGLLDTVVDVDDEADAGTGFVAEGIDPVSITAALFRAVRVLGDRRRRPRLVKRAMEADWSWQVPATRYADVYREAADRAVPRAVTLAGGEANAATFGGDGS